ncbi:MAG: hypothetical protein V3S22_03195 [Candidatus Neomarinimicrobiota bacterium]
MQRGLRGLLNLGLKLVYPAACLACRQSMDTGFICSTCLFKLEKITGNEWIKNIPYLSGIDRVYACWYYNPTLQALIQNMKYHNFARLGNFLGQKAVEEFDEEVFDGLDYLVPVPLNSLKYRERGYNQAQRISEGMAQVLKIPVKKRIKRIKYTLSQTSLTREERLYNMENAFVISGSVYQKKIGVIDDLLTTGATLSACAAAIKAAGAIEVRAITCASPIMSTKMNPC